MPKLSLRGQFVVVILVAAVLLVVGAAIVVSPWVKRVHSVAIEDGQIVLETSPDGRLANPNRTHFAVSLSSAAILGAVVMLLLGGGAVVLLLAISSLRKP
jgi:hypothetical protein